MFIRGQDIQRLYRPQLCAAMADAASVQQHRQWFYSGYERAPYGAPQRVPYAGPRRLGFRGAADINECSLRCLAEPTSRKETRVSDIMHILIYLVSLSLSPSLSVSLIPSFSLPPFLFSLPLSVFLPLSRSLCLSVSLSVSFSLSVSSLSLFRSFFLLLDSVVSVLPFSLSRLPEGTSSRASSSSSSSRTRRNNRIRSGRVRGIWASCCWLATWFRSLCFQYLRSPVKHRAHVVAVAHECDLALLTVEDEEFWKNTEGLTFGEVARRILILIIIILLAAAAAAAVCCWYLLLSPPLFSGDAHEAAVDAFHWHIAGRLLLLPLLLFLLHFLLLLGGLDVIASDPSTAGWSDCLGISSWGR